MIDTTHFDKKMYYYLKIRTYCKASQVTLSIQLEIKVINECDWRPMYQDSRPAWERIFND